MTKYQVRGFTILSGAEYLRNAGGEAAIEALSPALRHTLQTATSVSWQPADQVTELFHAVAKLGGGNEERAREHLEKCGEHQAKMSTGTFLKLIMKVLTPRMLAKKAPDLFSRDCTGGRLEVEVFDDHLTFHLKDMEVFEHFAPACVGYNQCILRTMGVNVTNTKLHGWSLDKPSAPEMWFSTYWEN